MEPVSSKNSFLVPIAIIVAGAMVAGAVYFGGVRDGANKLVDTQPNSKVEVAPVGPEDHILGNPSAQVTVIEYSDLECPFCKVFHNTMHQIVSEYSSKVSWVFRQFPIEQLHPKALKESEATECAFDQGGNTMFWKYLDQVFAITNSNNSLDLAELPKIAGSLGLDVTAFNTCLNSGKYTEQISKAVDDAVIAGARGTPYSVIVVKKSLTEADKTDLAKVATSRGYSADTITTSDDKKNIFVGGALPSDVLKEIIDIALR
ncbi:MAG: thioredoxin domain-containing protein [Patescibacteria group bacterium]